jgi:HEAT repeat protein
MKSRMMRLLTKGIVAVLGVALIAWLLHRGDWVREYVVKTVGHFGTPTVPYLREVALRDSSPTVRRQAGDALRKIGAAAVPSLLASLKDEKAAVRLEAANALRLLFRDAEEAVPDLIEALQTDPDIGVRHYAAKALGAVGPSAKQAIPALLAALKEPTPLVWAEAAETLGRICHVMDAEGVTPALIEALEDTDENVREEAAEALGRIDPRAKLALPALTKALEDPASGVRREARDAISCIQRFLHPGAPKRE